jgi:glycosyltransferase involved in cell wall biosynthesis
VILRTQIVNNKRKLLSIIIPAYNEGKQLKELLEKIIAAPLQNGVEKEIVVVDDGSTDNTKDILKEFSDKKLITAYSLIVNSGKGTAVRAGIKLATGDILIVQDGDLEYDPNDYAAVIQPILDGETEASYGSRFSGKIKKMKFLNKMIFNY